jgi:hypothetical protein
MFLFNSTVCWLVKWIAKYVEGSDRGEFEGNISLPRTEKIHKNRRPQAKIQTRNLSIKEQDF